MSTYFSDEEKQFSDRAHAKACEVFYPELFNGLPFEFIRGYNLRKVNRANC